MISYNCIGEAVQMRNEQEHEQKQLLDDYEGGWRWRGVGGVPLLLAVAVIFLGQVAETGTGAGRGVASTSHSIVLLSSRE